MAGKRAIFEEVAETQKPAATPGGISAASARGRGAARVWLVMLFVLVVAMIAVGGATRLTDSGLSITEWAPISGAIPPLRLAEWMDEFARYRQTDEYQLQNQGMTMAEFQYIYWWEWGHRQLGRFIGLIWAIGFFGLIAARRMPRGLAGIWLPLLGFAGFAALIGAEVATRRALLDAALAEQVAGGAMVFMVVVALARLAVRAMDWAAKFLYVGFLGGLQAAVGWWMVHSGLAPGMLDVASYRLAIHLGLAFVILAVLASYILQLSRPEADLMQARRSGDAKLRGMATGVLHLSFLQILLGALVAGIDAGRNYIDWPLMAGAFTPPGMWAIEPAWRNLFENDGTVQFFHRMTGYLLVLFGLVVWAVSRRNGVRSTKRAFDWMAVMLFGQMVIGIVTVMHSSPLPLGLLHQFGAVLVVTLTLRARFLAAHPLPQSVRN